MKGFFMNFTFGRIPILCLLIGVSACSGDSYNERLAKLETLVEKQRIGSSPDHWLVSSVGREPYRIALIFGVADSEQVCADLADYLSRTHGERYFCESAN
jgi:hypothetical protein